MNTLFNTIYSKAEELLEETINEDLEDEIYQKDLKDLKELEKKYQSLKLNITDRMITNDYIACYITTISRLYYLIGVRNTLDTISSVISKDSTI